MASRRRERSCRGCIKRLDALEKRLDTLTAQVDVVHRRVLDRDAKFAVIEARLALAEADLPAPVVQRVVRRKAAG